MRAGPHVDGAGRDPLSGDVLRRPPAAPASLSLALDDDQRKLERWTRRFANASSVRDEREETRWPLLREAARIGFCGWDIVEHGQRNPTGVLLALVHEELAWGDAGVGAFLTATPRRPRGGSPGV